MTEKIPVPKPKVAEIVENSDRGRNFTLAVPVLGIIGWLVLWQMGFIGSIVAWGISAATVYLYTLGAGKVSRSSVPWLIFVIVFSILLAFLSGIAADALAALNEETGKSGIGALATGEYWNYFLGALITPEVWAGYATDFMVAAAFGTFGAFSTIWQLLHEMKTEKPLP